MIVISSKCDYWCWASCGKANLLARIHESPDGEFLCWGLQAVRVLDQSKYVRTCTSKSLHFRPCVYLLLEWCWCSSVQYVGWVHWNTLENCCNVATVLRSWWQKGICRVCKHKLENVGAFYIASVLAVIERLMLLAMNAYFEDQCSNEHILVVCTAHMCDRFMGACTFVPPSIAYEAVLICNYPLPSP